MRDSPLAVRMSSFLYRLERWVRTRVRFAYYHAVHRLPATAIRTWQDSRLQDLVRHAVRNVPIWATIFEGAGLRARSFRGLIDLPKIPATGKETFIGRIAEEYIDSSRNIFTRWKTTSGTSGKPFTFLPGRNASSGHFTDFACYRFLVWNGLPLRKIATTKVARIKIRAISSTYRAFIPVSDFQSDPEKVYRQLVEYGPTILDTYTSILLDLAKMAGSGTLPLLRVQYAVSFGEMLSPASRHFIEQNLGCRVYDRYGTEEMGVIGLECSQHNGFHIHSESVVIEVTDDSFVPLPPGSYGRILATDLLNYNMPLIRYDTGDHGILDTTPCACGLETPRIWIEGRYSASLSFASGRRIHHLEFDGALDGFMNAILQYQVAKKSEEEVEIRIVPDATFESGMRDKIKESIRELVGETVAVRILPVTSISRMPRGKSQIVVDETATEPTAPLSS
ncbi:hypothetical protein K8R03_01685 [Candidatus Kaiserbacteria bacterium]|nr:hypothetical protein [Candidatus Kaiserbacteria bacterium]